MQLSRSLFLVALVGAFVSVPVKTHADLTDGQKLGLLALVGAGAGVVYHKFIRHNATYQDVKAAVCKHAREYAPGVGVAASTTWLLHHATGKGLCSSYLVDLLTKLPGSKA